MSKMIPKEGTCNCEACKEYWKASEAYWEALLEALWEVWEAHKGDG